MKIRAVGAELFRAEGEQTENETECVYCAVRSTFYVLPTQFVYNPESECLLRGRSESSSLIQTLKFPGHYFLPQQSQFVRFYLHFIFIIFLPEGRTGEGL